MWAAWAPGWRTATCSSPRAPPMTIMEESHLVHCNDLLSASRFLAALSWPVQASLEHQVDSATGPFGLEEQIKNL